MFSRRVMFGAEDARAGRSAHPGAPGMGRRRAEGEAGAAPDFDEQVQRS